MCQPGRPMPGAFPRGLAGLLRLPQGEIQRVFLQLIHADPGAAFQIFQILAAQTAIRRERADAEIHVSLAFVGQSLVHQLLDHGDDLGHMLRGPGMHGGGADAQRLGVHEILLDVAVGDLLDRYALFIGLADHLVVDVGEILHEGHFVAPVFQIAPQHVEDDEGPGVADVEVVVDGGAAGVNAHLSLMNGLELLFFPGHAVVNLHIRYSFSSSE